MGLSIKNPKAENLAREVARETGESITEALIRALEERLLRLRGRKIAPDTYEAIMAISQRCNRLRDRDDRTPEEILGYNDSGTFG